MNGYKNTPREHMLSRRVFFALLIKGRVHEVDVLLIQAILGETQSFAKAYKMEITSLQIRHSILMESLVA